MLINKNIIVPWSQIPNSENSVRLYHASIYAAITGDRHQMPYRKTHSQPTSSGQISVSSLRPRLGVQSDLRFCVDTTKILCIRIKFLPFFIHTLYIHKNAKVCRPYQCRPTYVKRKAIPLQAWTSPEGSGSLRIPYFKTVGTWGWLSVLHTGRLYPPGNTPDNHFC